MPTITQLEYLLAVDQEKHFGKASKLCHVSQPSLSTQIQKLEEELEVVIFDRSKKPIMTTDIGQEIINQAKIVIKEHRKLKDLAAINSVEIKGEFKLAVIPTLSPYLIPLFIRSFSQAFPKIQLKVSEQKTQDIIKLLGNDEIDAGLLVTPLEDDRIIERHLFFEPFYAYVSEGHPLLKKKKLAENDLNTNQLWLLEEGHCFREQVLKVCSVDKRATVLENVEFTSGNLETLKHLVRKSNGYTLLPELAVLELNEKEAKSHIIPFTKPAPTREVSLVHSRSFLKESIIKAMEETIIASLPTSIRSLKKDHVSVIDIQ